MLTHKPFTTGALAALPRYVNVIRLPVRAPRVGPVVPPCRGVDNVVRFPRPRSTSEEIQAVRMSEERRGRRAR